MLSRSLRSGMTALLLVSPLVLAGCSTNEEGEVTPPAVDVSPGTVDVPDVEAPDVNVPDVDVDVQPSEDGDAEAK